MKKVFTTTLCFLMLLLHSIAQETSYKIINIDTADKKSSYPVSFTVFKDKLYFYAEDRAHGMELRCYDGNSTYLVKDINPGPAHSVAPLSHTGVLTLTKNQMCVVGDTLYFSAQDTSGLEQLYKYDGVHSPSLAYSFTGNMSPTRGNHNYSTQANKLYFEKVIDPISAYPRILEYTPVTGAVEILSFNPTPISVPIIQNSNITFCALDTTGGQSHMFRYDPVTKSGVTFPSFYMIGIKINQPKPWRDSIFFSGESHQGLGRQIFLFNGNTIKNISYDPYQKIRYHFYYNSQNNHPYKSHTSQFTIYNDSVFYFASWNDVRHLVSYDPVSKITTRFITPNHDSDDISVTSYNYHLYYSDSVDMVFDFNTRQQQTLQSYYKLPPGIRLQLRSHIMFKNQLVTAAFIDSATGYELLILTDSTKPASINNVAHKSITATLYPNPTDKDAYLAITLPQAQSLQVAITDMNGRTVYNTQQKLYSGGKHNIPLRTQQLPTGNYIYTIRNEKNTLLQSGKMVKR